MRNLTLEEELCLLWRNFCAQIDKGEFGTDDDLDLDAYAKAVIDTISKSKKLWVAKGF